jgi:hypothetical protein
MRYCGQIYVYKMALRGLARKKKLEALTLNGMSPNSQI